MRFTKLAALAAVCCLPSCWSFEASGLVGYSSRSIEGDIGYVEGGSGSAVAQDVESALGLGEEQGSPYGRAMLKLGVPVLAVSGYTFEESGTGVLQANFGGNPALVAGTPVDTDFELANIKASAAFAFALGPVSVQPGIAVDWFDLRVRVRDQIGIANEVLELEAPVPLAFLRGEVDLGVVDALLEVGYIEADVDDVKGSLLDVEALVQVRPVSPLTLFAGYQMLHLDVEGTDGDDSFAADLRIGGFVIGGGLTW